MITPDSFGPDPFGNGVVAKIANELYQRPATVTERSAESAPFAVCDLPANFLADSGALPPNFLGSLDAPFNAEGARRDFPILAQRVNGKPLIWLDNAATTQKPQCVIDALSHFYEHDNSNVHRAAHALAARATDAYENARKTVAGFLGASTPEEIVFVRGTTEAINLVAQSYGRSTVKSGDEIVITHLEHHANIVPWQMLCEETGARLRVVPIDDRGEVLMDEYARLLGPRTRIVALTHVSNVLGTVLPIESMTALAKSYGAAVLIDGAQSIAHIPTNVQAIGCDFFAFSGHKIYGPTGVGVLYGHKAMLDRMPPWQGGGNMIDRVTFEHTTYAPVPAKFEAGTAILAGGVGLGAAIEYLERIGHAHAAAHEAALVQQTIAGLRDIPGLRLIGTAPGKIGVVSFVMDGIPNETIAKALDREGIAVRAGHHCAQPTMARYGVPGTVRPSFALYNTPSDVDVLVRAVRALSGGGLP